jgi:hypothetical protein
MIRLNRAADGMQVRETLSRAERKLRSARQASRTAWLVAGILAAAVTGSVIVWQILDRSGEPEATPDREEARTEHM